MICDPPEGIRITYQHDRMAVTDTGHVYAYWTPDTFDKIHPMGGRTTACIHAPSGRLIAMGTAVCSMSDNYVKETGRQIALERALWAAATNHRQGMPYASKAAWSKNMVDAIETIQRAGAIARSMRR
jgi:hypothetical protein